MWERVFLMVELDEKGVGGISFVVLEGKVGLLSLLII